MAPRSIESEERTPEPKVKSEERVLLGVVTGAVGIRGEVRVKPFTADAGALAAYGPVTLGETGTRAAVSVVRLAKNGVVARLKGVSDRNQAEALKGTELWIERAALPAEEENEFYHADLIGLVVEDLEGERLGEVKAIYDFGAGDMLDVRLRDGKTAMIPFTEACVPEVRLKEGKLIVDLPEGILPEDKKGEADV